jgi:hypothetical protein
VSTNDKTHWRVITPATWPAPPAEMSVSTHAEIEECPRRWALERRRVPGALGRARLPAEAPGRGARGQRRSPGARDHHEAAHAGGRPVAERPERAAGAARLGGYTRVVEECVERILKRYNDNPRAGALMEHAQRTLRGQVPTLRARVQSMLSRLRLPKGAARATAPSTSKSSGPQPRLPLANGTYPEVEVRAKSIGWKGKVDLLVLDDDACEITDFKTGRPTRRTSSRSARMP